MPTELLQLGQLTPLTQSIVYALPANAVFVMSSTTVDVGMTTGTTGWTALTNANTVGAQTSAPFIRCTTSTTCNVVVKRV